VPFGARMSEPTKVSRRLVAVFAADVEGYSRLMGADEVGTLKGLTERRAILDRIITYRPSTIDRAGPYSCSPPKTSPALAHGAISFSLLFAGEI